MFKCLLYALLTLSHSQSLASSGTVAVPSSSHSSTSVTVTKTPFKCHVYDQSGMATQPALCQPQRKEDDSNGHPLCYTLLPLTWTDTQSGTSITHDPPTNEHITQLSHRLYGGCAMPKTARTSGASTTNQTNNPRNMSSATIEEIESKVHELCMSHKDQCTTMTIPPAQSDQFPDQSLRAYVCCCDTHLCNAKTPLTIPSVGWKDELQIQYPTSTCDQSACALGDMCVMVIDASQKGTNNNYVCATSKNETLHKVCTQFSWSSPELLVHHRPTQHTWCHKRVKQNSAYCCCTDTNCFSNDIKPDLIERLLEHTTTTTKQSESTFSSTTTNSDPITSPQTKEAAVADDARVGLIIVIVLLWLVLAGVLVAFAVYLYLKRRKESQKRKIPFQMEELLTTATFQATTDKTRQQKLQEEIFTILFDVPATELDSAEHQTRFKDAVVELMQYEESLAALRDRFKTSGTFVEPKSEPTAQSKINRLSKIGAASKIGVVKEALDSEITQKTEKTEKYKSFSIDSAKKNNSMPVPDVKLDETERSAPSMMHHTQSQSEKNKDRSSTLKSDNSP